MRAFLFAMVLLAFILPNTPKVIFAQIPESRWADKTGFFRDRAINDLRVMEDRFYLATRAELYMAHDTGKQWESIFCLPRSSNEIHCIASTRAGIIYIGTSRGLFKSEDSGSTWRNVFKAITPAKNNILSIAVRETQDADVLISAQEGVFLSSDAGRTWRDISNILRNRAIRADAINHGGFYAGGEGGLFFTGDRGAHWERQLVQGGPGDKAEEPDGEGVDEGPGANREVRHIAVNDAHVYAAVDKAIYYSRLGEKVWQGLSGEGIEGFVNYVLPCRKTHKIFAATTRGVYEYTQSSQRWEALGRGAVNANVKKISFESDNEEFVWAATDKGLIKLETAWYIAAKRQEVENQLKNIFVMMDDEPTHEELQQAAIRYADVSPDKIKRWSSESRYRALFPRVSFGAGRDRSNNSEIYRSATKDYIVVGPDEVSNNLDLSVSWELGDLIWSDDQTNIDVRSRLMVQLRNDILDDLRRAYYERKRLLFELAMNPPKDMKSKFEKELRIQELTSTIDDLTGNYLSKRKKSQPD